MAHLIHFFVGFAVLLHVLFWGLGGALLIIPRPWRRFWPVLVVPVGFVLQSAVVWVGAYAGLPGTNSYAWPSELLPVLLLALGLWRRGPRAAWIDLSRFGLVWLLMAGCLAVLVTPLAIASKGLTTTSLGSCDAADYAAGARVFMEFAHHDRSGFIGLTEVVEIGSTDNFFDFWLRLNHFSPSALIALNGTILHCAPHELTGLVTMVFLAGMIPFVFWIARAVFGYSGAGSLGVALIFALSPITWYAVAHVAMSQLLGAQAIAVITWPGIALWRGRLSRRRALQFSGVLVIGYGLLLGSYNFMLLVCLVPSVAFAGGLTLWRGDWPRLKNWLIAMAVPLVASSIFFWARVAVLPERFLWFRTYDFGWRIPAFSPEGWLGMIRGPGLEPWWLGVRWILAVMVSVALGWGLMRSIRRRHPGAWLVIAVTVPVLLGYIFLEARGAKLGTNASYDAYKLFMVFYPLLLPGFCWWITLRRSARLTEWMGVVALAGLVVACNLAAAGMFIWRMAQPPLIVDGELRQLRKVEAMADVKSVNLLIPDMWSRLWANSFLLHKPQYFPTHTYEGRRNTPLRGEWDLEGGLISVRLAGDGRRQITPRFALVDTRRPNFVRAMIDEAFDHDWHPEEHPAGSDERWRWTSGDATMQIDNPHPYPVSFDSVLDAWSPIPRRVSLTRVNGEARPLVPFRDQRVNAHMPVLGLPPGRSTLVFQLTPPAAPVAGDPRPLGLCVFRFTIIPRE